METKVVLITGAAGGLGRGLTAAFADAGWHVAAGYHTQHPPAGHDRVWSVPLDVTVREAPARVVDEVVARWGRLDALINNAGVIADGLVAGLDEAAWDRVIGVNLTGAMACARAAVWPMIRQRDGHIVNLGSFAARRGSRGQANYAAAKAGLIGLTQSLAGEMGSRNIRVNAVLPGVLPTGMTAGLDPGVLEKLVAANVLRRGSTVEEVARFVVFLCGLKHVSAQVFQLDSRPARWS